MKLRYSCAVAVLALALATPYKSRADYLQTNQPGAGSATAGSVSTSPAVTTHSVDSAPPETIVDNHDAGWTWSGMTPYTDPYLYQKSGYAGGPGSYGVYNFHGTGVEITGVAGPTLTVDGVSHVMGAIKVFIDSKEIAINSLRQDTAKYRDTIFKIDGLDNGNHVLHLEPLNGWISVNYITVLNTPPPAPQPAATTSDAGPESFNNLGFRLVPQGSTTLCMDVAPGPLKGAKVQLWDIDASRMQTWMFNPIGSGKYTLSPAGHPEVVLWVIPLSPDGKLSQLFLWPYTGSPNEILTVDTLEKGKIDMQAQGKNMAVGVWHDGFQDGAPVVGDLLNYVYGQTWYMQKSGN